MLPLFFEFLWLFILLYTLNNGSRDSGSLRAIVIWGILIVCLTVDKCSVFILRYVMEAHSISPTELLFSMYVDKICTESPNQVWDIWTLAFHI